MSAQCACVCTMGADLADDDIVREVNSLLSENIDHLAEMTKRIVRRKVEMRLGISPTLCWSPEH